MATNKYGIEPEEYADLETNYPQLDKNEKVGPPSNTNHFDGHHKGEWSSDDFANRPEPKKIILRNITEIKDYAFEKYPISFIGGPEITRVDKNGLSGCGLSGLSFPKLEVLGENALSGDNNYELLDFSETLKYISKSCFYMVKSFKTLILRSKTMVTLEHKNAFAMTIFGGYIPSQKADLYVPESLIQAYQEDSVWSQIMNNTNVHAIEGSEYERPEGNKDTHGIVPESYATLEVNHPKLFKNVSSGYSLIGNQFDAKNCGEWTMEGIASGVEPYGDIVLSDTITEIEDRAFARKAYITSVKGKNVETVGNNAFIRCSGIRYLDFNNWFPSLKTIGDYSAEFIDNLEWADFPSTFTELGKVAFGYCTNLHRLIFRSPTVVTVNGSGKMTQVLGATPFVGKDGKTADLYVPGNLIEDYQNDDQWASVFEKGFTTIHAIEGSEYE